MIYIGFCIPLSSATLNQQAFPPLFSSVTGDIQPSLQRLLMVTAVAQADQGTYKSAIAALLVHLLRGSQFTSCWL